MKPNLFLLLFLSIGCCLQAQTVTSLTLVDATSNSEIGPLAEGDVINLAEVGTSLNVIANVSGTVGSVKFTYDESNIGSSGSSIQAIEGVAPYAMRGDNSGNYHSWTPSVGNHTLTVTAYSAALAGGTAGTPYVVNFQVINNDTPVEYDLPVASGTGEVSQAGELKKWHKITLSFDGPAYKESDTEPNPFLDFSLEVTFTNGSETYVVPGYFAADGDAAETSADSGNVWRVHFSPSLEGEWTWTASFKIGDKIAVAGDKSYGKLVTPMDGKTGSFTVGATDKSGRDLRAKGRLQYVGEHYLKFAETGKYFIKGGPDAPENLLAYDDFDGEFKTDGTSDDKIKSWTPHLADWNEGDPRWQDGKGTELIGAINYLAEEGLNAFSFLTMNIGGDDKNVYPYPSNSDFKHMDCSKLDQWGIVFDHAMTQGMYLHFKTQETENETLLDGGNVGTNRKLYYRELIARFGYHLALNWNLGEENKDQSDAQRKEMAEYFYNNDPYHNHIVIHTYPDDHSTIFQPLLGNKSKLTGVSIQTPWNNVHNATSTWVTESRNADKKWVVANDEQGSANIGVPNDTYTGSPNLNDIRKQTLWGNLLAGGAGVEYYFGYQLPSSDLTCEDFRSRDLSWDYVRHAINFFDANELPIQQMTPNDDLVSNGWCLASQGQVYLVYLMNGGTSNLNISQNATYNVQWYDPRNGGELQDGSITSISGTGAKTLGTAPNNTTDDWLVVVTNSNGINLYPTIVASADTTIGIDSLTVTFDATGTIDEDGSVVSCAWDFGDDTTDEGQTVTHKYTSIGTFDAVLTVTDDNGAIAQKIFTIKIEPLIINYPCGDFETMMSKDFPLNDYYLDSYTGQQILAITPGTSPVTATTQKAFAGETCKYNIIFHGVGENDGRSAFKIFVNDEEVGAYDIPLSTKGYEIADKYNLTIPDVSIFNGDIIKVIGTTGSADGQEWSRARWIKIDFEPTGLAEGDCQGAQFAEKNGIAVIEVESVAATSGWEKKTSPAGFSGESFYMWNGSDNFNTPGNGILEYKVHITNPGTYHFRWHCKIMNGTSTTDCNDTWLKIPDADDFFGKSGSSIKYPKGGMFVQSNVVTNGASANGWMKVYSSGTTGWTWSCRTSDSNAHEIYATFNEPGVYTIQISARSRYHAIDRMVLFNDSKYSVNQATSLALSEILCGNGISDNIPLVFNNTASINAYPNPVGDVLNVKIDNIQFGKFRVTNLLGKVVAEDACFSSELVLPVKEWEKGIYILQLINSETHKSVKFVKK